MPYVRTAATKRRKAVSLLSRESPKESLTRETTNLAHLLAACRAGSESREMSALVYLRSHYFEYRLSAGSCRRQAKLAYATPACTATGWRVFANKIRKACTCRPVCGLSNKKAIPCRQSSLLLLTRCCCFAAVVVMVPTGAPAGRAGLMLVMALHFSNFLPRVRC